MWANYVGKLLSNFKGFYNEINSATLTGAIDVVVVKQEDGSYVSSPFHVRFGKMGVLRAREKVVDIEINGEPVDLHMKLGEAGEAFFVEETGETEFPPHLATSPIPSYGDLMEQGLRELKSLSAAELKELKERGFTSADLKDFSASDDSRTRHYTTSSSATDDLPLFSPPVGETMELTDVITQDMSDDKITAVLDMALEKSPILDTSADSACAVSSAVSCGTESIPCVELAQSPSIAVQTVMTLSDVEEHQSRTPPRPSPARDAVDGSRPLVERMPSVITGEGGTPPQLSVTGTGGTPPRGPPPVVRLDTKFTDNATDTNPTKQQKRRFRRKKYGSPARSPGRSPVRFESKDSKGSATKGLVRPKALKAVDEIKSGSPAEKEDDMFPMDMSDDDTEMTPVGSMEEGLLGLTSMGRTISMPVIQDSASLTEDWCNSHSASAFHPFSDTDITPITSPIGSRPPSPKSDTEYETQKYDVMSQTLMTGEDLSEDSVSWKWGELPEKTPDANGQDKDKGPKALGGKEMESDKPRQGLFHFMRKTKKIRHQPKQGGIYLDDLNLEAMDPEIAQLYLYQTKSGQHRGVFKDEDSESGRGASLPQSPVSIDSDHSNSRDYLKAYKQEQSPPVISMSLCGGLKEQEDIPTDKFLQDLVTYDEFCENPDIIQDPNLVIKIDNKYYNWQIAGPIVMSVVVFQRPIPDHGVDCLIKKHMPKKETKRRGWIWWRTVDEGSQTEKKDQGTTTTSQPSSAPSSTQNSPEKHKERSSLKRPNDDASTDEDTETNKTKNHSSRVARRSPFKRNEKYKKSLKLTSEQIETMGLKDGSNEVTFSVTTAYQGTARCVANIYVWNWDDRIVVSDIDGTVTRSDVLGHVLPMIGKDWSQAGIAKLYNMIYNNGYKFLYLSARAIGQSRVTRDYLRSVRQGDLELPDGPVLLSPSSLISAFHKEVIERKPEEFKISCLRDISALFPPARNPFFAGYGNKVNDVWAYRAVGIPISRIFTVNHRGELRMEQLKTTFQTSYSSLTDITDHFFPPLLEKQKVGKMASGNFHGADSYSSFTYWREPLPDIEIEVEPAPASASGTSNSPAAAAASSDPETAKS